jgi:hypothetical protein
MFPGVMALFSAQGRKVQFLTFWTILTLVFILIFYYMSVSRRFPLPLTHTHKPRSWNTLQYSTPSTSSSSQIKDAALSATSCPPPPACSPPPPPPSPYDATKVAFLVETRPLPHLPALFAHMTTIIPPEWTFRFMGSPVAISSMRKSPLIPRLEKSGKLTFLELPSNYSLKDRETISQMFTDSHLYADILAPAEHLLVFQPDSIFCANAPKTLNDFLEYDWIGAPWSKTAQYGGNGGLSLRKVSKILEVLSKESRRSGDGALEDLWISHRMNQLPGAKMANATISKTFSVESVWDESPLGYHIGWLGVHHEQVSSLVILPARRMRQK